MRRRRSTGLQPIPKTPSIPKTTSNPAPSPGRVPRKIRAAVKAQRASNKAKLQQWKTTNALIPQTNFSGKGNPVRKQMQAQRKLAQAAATPKQSKWGTVRSKLASGQIVASPQPTTTALQNLSSAGRKMQASVGRGMTAAGRSTSAGMAAAGQRLAAQTNAMSNQAGKFAARIHENRPMTTMGMVVRFMCVVLFFMLSVRFLMVGAPKEVWITFMIWSLLMMIYFYQRMDLCVKPL